MRQVPLALIIFTTTLMGATQPNILFVLTDDQGWSSLGCYGNTRVETPHLDRLASQGMRFTQAYALPQCTPTRAAFLTGQHSARNGMWHVIGWYGTPWAPVQEPPFRENLSRDQYTLAKGLKQAGYRTGIIGKWHLTTNNDGHYVGLKPHAAPAYGFDFCAEPPSPRYHQSVDKGVDWMTDEAIAFAKRNRHRPWFCYLSHHTIHGPVRAPDSLIAKYRQQGAPETGLHNATYLAAIDHLDQSIGRLMAGLDELGEAHETVVVFFCDNGGVYQQFDITPFKDGPGTDQSLRVSKEEFSNAPLRAGKGSAYEGGIREPLIIRWPGTIKPGTVESTPVHVIDFLPTFLDMAGSEPHPNHTVDGISLVPVLKGNRLQERALLWYLPLYDLRWGATPCAVIRRGPWKLIEHFGDRIDRHGKYRKGHHIELFHLQEDIGETINRAQGERDRVETLRTELHQLIRDCHAPIPSVNPYHDPTRALKETRSKPPFVLRRPNPFETDRRSQ